MTIPPTRPQPPIEPPSYEARRVGGCLLSLVVLLAALWLMACGPAPVTIPYDVDVPTGGTVIYRNDHSRIGFYGYPVRIVQIGDRCITEDYESGWAFVSSEPCSAVAS